MNDIDYVKLYAEKMSQDNRFFKDQKAFIESQLHASQELFTKQFGVGDDFKKNARKYLKSVGML